VDKRKFNWLVIGLIFLGIIIVSGIASIYIDVVWFESVKFVSIFWKILLTKGFVIAFFSALFFTLSYINLSFARKFAPEFKVELDQSEFERPEIQLYKSLQNIQVNKKFVFLFSLVAAVFMGFSENTSWEKILIYLNRTSFGINDPIFNRDIGFYMFSLPFLEFIRNWLFFSLTILTIVVGAIYVIKKAIKLENRKIEMEIPVKIHLSILIGILLILKSGEYWLKTFKILYSDQVIIFGAGYTDVYANLLALRILIFLALLCAVLIFITAKKQDLKLPMIGLAVLLGVSALMGTVYPEIIQRAVVLPNESTKEKPFIANNIKYTRMAYGLEKIKEEQFPVKEEISLADIEKNSETIGNIRLWDWRPIKQTLRQIQAIRLYYDFNSVDIDRYYFNGNYQQVMISPRELDTSKIPEQARTWINEHLTFTHGYGVVINPVNKISGEGLPFLLVKDIPPVSSVNMEITRPEIYYGELTNNYVIVKTKAKEFDYPKGDENVYSTYAGNGGLSISSLWRRILFSIKYSNPQILLTTNFTRDSRIMIYRNIQERVNKVAPFLGYDKDPYIVVSKEGKLYWIQDAYTISNNYPYSTPLRGYFNYIRNSVKVIIDAYDGSIDFYIVDQNDPVIKVYEKIFPKLFKGFDQMPQDLKEHIRYPKDLFQVQAELYSTYHMVDSDVFYNKEDYWNIPNEIYAENEIKMEPYYIVTKVPGHEREEFILMTPFTPATKNNMIAWLAAKNDQPEYGNLVVYKFPKDKLIFGPMQIEARIDQDSEISQQLTLWGQKGSTVIRGNLLVIPIEESIIYVEPLYLRAEKGEIPELKRVIISNGTDVVIGNNLEDALGKLFAGAYEKEESIVISGEEKTLQDLILEASEYYQNAQQFSREGNWSGYGEELNKLEQTLKLLEELSRKE